MEEIKNYKLTFYVPESHLELVKNALFAAGAGRLGNYEQCCWQTLGQGQFKPLAGANPSIGSINELTQLPEYKVEILCSSATIHEIILALKNHHPYESPGYDVFRLEDF